MSDLQILKDKVKVPLADASADQLRRFAQELGLTIKPATPVHMMRKQIAVGGWEQDYIVTDPDEGVAPTKPGRVAKAAALADGEVEEPMVEITIANQEGPGGKQAVFVGVNGRGILVPRNKRCLIKLRYVNALEIAVGTSYELSTDEVTGRESITASDAPTHPVQVHRYPSDEAVAAWKAFERTQPEWHNSYKPGDAQAA